MVAGPIIKPYEQGEFDALCGIYAIINAFRKTLGQDDRLPNSVWEELFCALIEEVDERVGLVDAMLKGMATMHVLWLVRYAAAMIRRDYGRIIDCRRPLLRSRVPTATDVINHFRSYSECEDKAILIWLGGTLGHWTVIDRVGQTYLSLFDSGGHRRVKLSRCRMHHEAPRSGSTEHIIRVGAIIMVTNTGSVTTGPP